MSKISYSFDALLGPHGTLTNMWKCGYEQIWSCFKLMLYVDEEVEMWRNWCCTLMQMWRFAPWTSRGSWKWVYVMPHVPRVNDENYMRNGTFWRLTTFVIDVFCCPFVRCPLIIRWCKWPGSPGAPGPLQKFLVEMWRNWCYTLMKMWKLV